jgi:hypothetical protein
MPSLVFGEDSEIASASPMNRQSGQQHSLGTPSDSRFWRGLSTLGLQQTDTVMPAGDRLFGIQPDE